MTEAEWIAFLRRPEIPAFNRAMLDNPADDLPRLVFADWMDEKCPDTAVNAAVRRSITNGGELIEWPGLNRVTATRLFVRGRLRVYISGSTPPPTRQPNTMLDALWRARWVYDLCFNFAGVRAVRAWLNDPPL